MKSPADPTISGAFSWSPDLLPAGGAGVRRSGVRGTLQSGLVQGKYGAVRVLGLGSAGDRRGGDGIGARRAGARAAHVGDGHLIVAVAAIDDRHRGTGHVDRR